jgi:hypothetical protein
VSAELAARRTAAAAVLAGYLSGAGTADPNALSMAAARLADALAHLLAVLDEGDQAAAQFPAAAVQLAEIRLVLDGFDWEYHDRQLALEAIDEIVNRGQS